MERTRLVLLKNYGFLELSILFFILSFSGCKEAEQKEISPAADPRPNVILIIADDAGWNDVGYHGSEIMTPNIDKLAEEGVQLNRFYVYPTCSPTRASLLTGIPASRIGIVAPISGRSQKVLPDSIFTLPEVLRSDGYTTALLGKWHLGLKPESGPAAYGFDYSYGFLHGQIDQYSHNYKNGDSSWHRNGKFITESGHVTDLIGKEAINYIRRKSSGSKPFFLQIAYSAPHFLLQEPFTWKEIYKNDIPDSSRLEYAAAMTHMDYSIGNVLQEISNAGIEENTVIIFMSDNGAQENWYPDTQYNGRYGPNSSLGSNYPFRGYKTSNYEGGIRVPAIVYWKSKIPKASNNNDISVIDIMPTIMHLADVEKIIPSVEGKNMWNSILTNKSSGNLIYKRGHLQESIMRAPWKLIRTRFNNKAPRFELYHIEEDSQELNNKIFTHPKIGEELKNELLTQFSRDAAKVNVELPH